MNTSIEEVVEEEVDCPLAREDAEALTNFLKAIADPTRLRILSLLRKHEGTICVGEIVERFTLCQPTISHHLRILRDAGLIFEKSRAGLWNFYVIRRRPLGLEWNELNELIRAWASQEEQGGQ